MARIHTGTAITGVTSAARVLNGEMDAGEAVARVAGSAITGSAADAASSAILGTVGSTVGSTAVGSAVAGTALGQPPSLQRLSLSRWPSAHFSFPFLMINF